MMNKQLAVILFMTFVVCALAKPTYPDEYEYNMPNNMQ